MINLVGTSPKTAMNALGVLRYRQHSGLLTSPKSAQNPAYAAAVGAKWAMDNDAFTGFEPRRFLECLTQWRYVPGCLFVVAPDVIQNAGRTLEYFWWYQPIIAAFGLPVAFVLQNGMHNYHIPWAYCDALFIGGSTDFKYTPYVRWAVAEAGKRGKWVHNGRVNSKQRIWHSALIGCDSFDGTSYAIAPGRIAKEFDWWVNPPEIDVCQLTIWRAS
jgi:hypothetical protein